MTEPDLSFDNAATLDISQMGKPKFLLSGRSGSGKSAQLLTLPGKTFAYFFDPAALSTVRGHDLDFKIFVPKVVSLAARSLTKGKGDQKKLKEVDAHEVYLEWENDIEARIGYGFFEPYDNIIFDSFTTFADVVMDRILSINDRLGQWPQQDDWTAQMNTIRNVVRTLTGQADMTLICTAHEETVQDELTKRLQNEIILTGKLRAKLPLLFSDVWHLEVGVDNSNNLKYTAQTVPDKMNPAVRTSFRNLEKIHDITIRDWKRPHDFGIGKIMRDNNLVKLKGEG